MNQMSGLETGDAFVALGHLTDSRHADGKHEAAMLVTISPRFNSSFHQHLNLSVV